MKTHPGAKVKYTRPHRPLHRQSSTIPPTLPIWRKIADPNSDHKFYARLSIYTPNFITIFNCSERTTKEISRSVVCKLFTIGDRCTPAENHRVEDLYECMVLAKKNIS